MDIYFIVFSIILLITIQFVLCLFLIPVLIEIYCIQKNIKKIRFIHEDLKIIKEIFEIEKGDIYNITKKNNYIEKVKYTSKSLKFIINSINDLDKDINYIKALLMKKESLNF